MLAACLYADGIHDAELNYENKSGPDDQCGLNYGV